jgi:hypothetical protein
MCALPKLREALRSGRLTLTKALLVAKVATPETVVEEIERAASTTWQQSERESTEKEVRQNRARGGRRVWGPKDAMLVLAIAIRAVQAWVEATEGRRIGAGEAVGVMSDHCVEVWTLEVKEEQRWWSKARKEVFGRTQGICAWPGCSRAAVHDHHIRPRSAGGSDEVANRCGSCGYHHMVGIHDGYLLIEGRAGECLVFLRRDGLGEVWEVVGENEARRRSSA